MKENDAEGKIEVAEIASQLYQLGYEESYKVDEKDVMLTVLRNHLYDLGFDDIYVSQLLSEFKKGFHEGNVRTKELFVKKYLFS